jgi:hypothetical protein
MIQIVITATQEARLPADASVFRTTSVALAEQMRFRPARIAGM